MEIGEKLCIESVQRFTEYSKKETRPIAIGRVLTVLTRLLFSIFGYRMKLNEKGKMMTNDDWKFVQNVRKYLH